jgi:signal transduction histidine kinase
MFASGGLAVSATLLRKASLRHGLVVAQLPLIVIVSIPNGRVIWPETWAVLGYVVQATSILPLVAGVLLSLLLIGFVWALQQQTEVWSTTVPAPESELVLVSVLFSLLFLIVSSALRYVAALREGERRQLKTMNDVMSRLIDANMRFQRYASEIETSSAENERRRITRELHDSVGYALTNFMMMMEAAKDLIKKDPERLQRLISSARERAEETLADTKRTLRQFRKEIDLNRRGIHRIQDLTNAFQEATGVRVDLWFANLPLTLGPDVDAVLFRIVQEGMTNSFHHGQATHVEVVFRLESHGVRASVRDNGEGAESISEGIGFKGLRERLGPIGGTLTTRNLPNGFELSAWIPRDTEVTSE